MEERRDRLTPEQKQALRRRRLLKNRMAQGLCILIAAAVMAAAANALLLLTKDRTFSEAENRMLAQKPALTAASLADGSFAENAQRWYADQFPGRDGWIAANTAFSRLLGQREMNGVYLGADGYLMEKPAEADDTQLEKTLDAIRAFAALDPARPVYLAVVPTAACVLEDKLPPDAPVEDEQAAIRTFYGTLDNVTGIDVTDGLRARADAGLYYRTDHHWTSLGAYAAFQTMAPQLGLDADAAQFTPYTVSTTFEGTLASKTGSRGVYDTITIYAPADENLLYDVTYTDTQTTVRTLYDRQKLAQKNQYEVFFGGNHARVDIRTTADTGRTLLLLKDSYANCFVQFLLPYYDRIIMIDPRYYYDDLGALLRREAITDVLMLYNYNTFVQDHALAVVLRSAAAEGE